MPSRLSANKTAGDFVAQTLGLGYVVGFYVTVAALVVILLAQVRAGRYHPARFGAASGAVLTKKHARGGLELGTLQTSLVATALMVLVVHLSSRLGGESRALVPKA